MKKTIFSVLLASMMAVGITSAQNWAPAGDKIKTKWANQIDVKNVLPEYPRPQMTRSEWQNLNGLWNYAIIEKGAAAPKAFDGKILVPFAIESSLSGVQKMVAETQELWYDRTFEVPSKWRNKDIILHFGAVDWKADVYVNDQFVGTHTGGYVPFCFNVTPYLKSRGAQKLNVRVWDPTNAGEQPRGKQVNDPKGIWYTPVTGIWQSVWMEPVAKAHISNVKSIPNLDNKNWAVTVSAEGTSVNDIVEVNIFDGTTKVATANGAPGAEIKLVIDEPKLWSPDSPFLYDMKVSLVSGGKKVDEVGSYTAMRKISKDRYKGKMRMFLNNEPLFHFGPLDQGWWPDGLYTQPTDEALLFDIVKTKDLGFNMIRKHVKVECARWYWHCDREGILVWQDMPSGKHPGGQWQKNTFNGGRDTELTDESKANFRKEWKEIMDFGMSFPSIVIWVPFNEAWGQFETLDIAKWTKEYDRSRLVNPASGGNHTSADDILDVHEYPGPRVVLFNGEKVNVLGEYGGIGYMVPGHIWNPEMRNWGYSGLKKDTEELMSEYVRYTEEMRPLIDLGFAAAVYTQTTDVEGEVNGLITYDREVIKVDEARIKAANQAMINYMKK